MKKHGLIGLTLLVSVAAGAQESPLWVRQCAISPKGDKIAFTYKGDLYVVGRDGGRASQLTSDRAYESSPIWSPDGKSIVFTSTREGSPDIFITSAEGGKPRRLTTFPGSETPLAALEGGKVVFRGNISVDAVYGGFPGGQQLYVIDEKGGRPEMVSSLQAMSLSVGKDGKVLYEDYKGYEDPLRKHHTSAVTRDIWLYTPPKGNERGFSISPEGSFKKVSTYVGEDRNPVFAADGDTYYFLSEADGKTSNVYKASLSKPGAMTQLTFETKNPVRSLSVATDGTIAYSYNGELYTLKEGGKPVKVEISVARDEPEREKSKSSYSTGATSMAVSPNGKEIALVIRGDVFVTSVEYNTTNRITDTPEQERNVSFSEDGRTLYYSSERDGNWGVYRTSLTEKDDKYFTYAFKMKEELFSERGETSFLPKVSPDGKWVAYLRDRTELVVKPAKGGKVKSLMKGVNYSYSDGDMDFEWSPDSERILYTSQANGGWNNPDVAVVDIESGDVTNLTQSGYSDGNFKWALNGLAMTWETDKNGYRSHGSWGAESDIYAMFFNGKTFSKFLRDKEGEEIVKMQLDTNEKKADKKEKKDSVATAKEKPDFEHVADRQVRLTRSSNSYGDHYLSEDGSKLFYVTPLESGYGLCAMDMKTRSVNVVERNVYGSIIPSKDGKDIFIFSSNSIKKLPVAGGSSKTISYSGDYEYKPAAEREYIFNHVWKQVKEKFYDPDIHGIDWEYYKENYSRFLPYINNNYDFADMLSEMLGELNGSHTGARYYAPSGVRPLGRLGLIYDKDYEGDGLLIKEVLPDGPVNLADSEVKEGDIVKAINGKQIKAGEDWFPIFTGIAGKKTMVTIRKGHKDVEIFVTPSTSESDLLYKRWVRRNEETVKKLSGGKIGYVHVQGMNSESFREVYSKALGKYRTCDALIVDTRHNGGGWLHDDLATFLNGKAYIKFTPRGQYVGTEPYNKWTKPSCVLVCEDNYSDASGFPYVYKTLGIGKVIGAPVAGTMTAVWWENQIDASLVFGIPQVGSLGLKEGRYLENMQLEPDILVYNAPEEVLMGKDAQLEAAVREMLKETGNGE